MIETLGDKIKAQRSKLNLSAAKFGSLIGRKGSGVSQWIYDLEKGRIQRIDMRTLRLLSEVCSVPLYYFTDNCDINDPQVKQVETMKTSMETTWQAKCNQLMIENGDLKNRLIEMLDNEPKKNGKKGAKKGQLKNKNEKTLHNTSATLKIEKQKMIDFETIKGISFIFNVPIDFLTNDAIKEVKAQSAQISNMPDKDNYLNKYIELLENYTNLLEQYGVYQQDMTHIKNENNRLKNCVEELEMLFTKIHWSHISPAEQKEEEYKNLQIVLKALTGNGYNKSPDGGIGRHASFRD